MSSQNNPINKEMNGCEKCGEQYLNFFNATHKWCKPCQINRLKKYGKISGNEKIDKFIHEMRLKIICYNESVFEWIPYDQFEQINLIGKGGFATVYSAIWKDGPLYYNENENGYTKNPRRQNKKVALKCLFNSRNITNEFLNEVKAHAIMNSNHILKIYGMSQNFDTKDYIMVLEYAEGGDLNEWMNKNRKDFNWNYRLKILFNLFNGLDEIHQKQLVHHDFHTGNILIKNAHFPYISDMGLCRGVNDLEETKITGVMPYVSPEVLRGNPYTKAADIYSLGMIMYFIATGKQPFSNCAHDQYLALNICNGVRPEINEVGVPKCYIDLMKRCWDKNPDSRPNIAEVKGSIFEFYGSYTRDASKFKTLMKIEKGQQHYEIEKQFIEAEEYRKASIENDKSTSHSQAIYSSRLLNDFTKDLSKYDNIENNSVEIIDFTKFII